jgi:hypothetical protein
MKRIPTECGVPECDREASIIRRSWPTGAVFAQLVGVTTSESMFCPVKYHWQRETEFRKTDAGSSYSLCSLLLAFFSFDFDASSVPFHT